jgi:hypothetical protein
VKNIWLLVSIRAEWQIWARVIRHKNSCFSEVATEYLVNLAPATRRTLYASIDNIISTSILVLDKQCVAPWRPYKLPRPWNEHWDQKKANCHVITPREIIKNILQLLKVSNDFRGRWQLEMFHYSVNEPDIDEALSSLYLRSRLTFRDPEAHLSCHRTRWHRELCYIFEGR